MATTLEVERQLSNAGYMPQGVDFSPRFTAPADIEGIVRGAAGRYGLNPDDAVAVARLESGLNPRAQNPNSSAGGLFQFVNSTWGQYGGGDKYDPARNADAGARYLRDVRDTLTRGLGRAPTVGELYLGHQQGAAGALRILQNPDGLARDAVGPDAVVLNGGTIDMTNRDFAMRWDRRASRAAGQAPGILDTIGAAARQNIGIAGLLGYGMPFHRGADDPTFNAITTADADPALRPYLSQFIDVRNREEYDRTAERVRRASDDKETLAAAGPFGMAASVAAGILDPINLIPVGGGAWKLMKAGRYVEGALGGIIAGGGGAALQELMLQQADPTRTAEDAGLNIVSGALGGAGLGVGSVAASGSASRLARAGILGAGGAAGGAAAGLGEALYSGQDLGGALATIGTSAVIGGLLGGSVGALARPGRTARDGLHDLARTVDIETDTGNGAIYADVRRQLLAAGRPEAEADAGGKLWQSHVDAVSRATGVPQADVYRSIGLDVRTGDVPEGALAQSGRDLPMDEASRLERAREMGFTIDAYHGSGADFAAFSSDAEKATGGGLNNHGFFFSSDPKVASRYADSFGGGNGKVYPVLLKVTKPLVLNARGFEVLQDVVGKIDRGESISETKQIGLEVLLEDATGVRPPDGIKNVIEWIKNLGFDAIEKTRGGAGAEPEIMVFSPDQVRSRFAKFDPAHADSPDLLAQDIRGAVDFRDGMARITLGAKADASTFLHESGHVFLGTLDRLAAQSQELAADMAKVREWLGNDGGDPQVAEGLTRFYHGGGDAHSGGGRWLTPYRNYAEGYAQKSAGEVWYVDIPTDSPMLTKAFDDEGTSVKSPFVNFEAPEAIARQLKRSSGEAAGLTREQHERWARGFEAYLREGKAPNSALREVFERFRDWLTAIYRSLADLDVELSDDVRGVMDRLIGVDDEPAPGRGGSLSAAKMPVSTMDDLRIGRTEGLLASIPGLGPLDRALAATVEPLARIQSRIPIAGGPDLILGTSPVLAARWAMRKLMRPVLATQGDLQRGGTWTEETLPDGRVAAVQRPVVATENVESAMQQWHGGEVAAKHQANAIYTDYAKAAAAAGEPVLKHQQIIDAASQAGRRGDSGAKLALGPEAQKAAAAMAKAYREAVFDPLLKQALEHGLLTKAQVEKARRFAESYIPRVWNINKILERRNQFTAEVVMPQVVRDWEDARAKLARMRQTTRFADEQLRQIEAAGIEHGGPEAAAFIAEGPALSPAQIMRENVKHLQAALDDPFVQWADGDEDRARMLIAKSRTPVIAQGGMEGIRKGGPALTDAEAQEVQDMLYRTRGLRPTDETDIGVRATRAVQAMQKVAVDSRDQARALAERARQTIAVQREAAKSGAALRKEAETLLDRIMTAADAYRESASSAAEGRALSTKLAARSKALQAAKEDLAETIGKLDALEEESARELSAFMDQELTADAEGRLADANPAGAKDLGKRIERLLRMRKPLLDRADALTRKVEDLAADFDASQKATKTAQRDSVSAAKSAGRGGAMAESLRRVSKKMRDAEARSDKLGEEVATMLDQRAALMETGTKTSVFADQYDTALKKSLRERAKAYRTLDADDNLGRLDESELPVVASDIVDALVGHTNNRLQYEALKVTARGAMKEKTFNVRDELVDGGNGGENWLENDIELLASRYTRTLAPDVELKRLTGDVNAEPLRQQIIQEYTDKAAGMEDGPKKLALDKRLKRDLEAFDGVVSRLRGTYGLPKDAGEVWGLRASRVAKAFNFVRLMGNGPISQLPDIGRIVFRSGMTRFLGDAVMPMISNWDAVRLTKRELQQADIATELVRSSMALRGAEMFDEYSNISKVEQVAQKVAAGASRLYGLDHWNQGAKTIAGLIAQSSLVDGVRKLAAGADMKPTEIADLSRVGIGAREAEFIKPFLDEFGRDVRGIFIPNTADWAGDGAADAARLWRGAMRQIADDMVINPGQDRSLFLSKPFRSMLFQLETFNLVSTQRTILAGLQRRDAGVFVGAGMMVGLGMLSYWLKAKIASWVFGSTSSWKLPDSPGDWILQGVNQSGLLGVISSIDQRLLAATRGAVGSEALVGSPTRSRFAAADFASLFGPTASAGQIAFTSLQNAAAGDWNWKDTHRLRSLAPMQNYFIVRGLFDQAEKRLNEVMGVRRPVQQR